MNPKELLQAAHDAQPETMNKVAAMLFLADRLDPELAAEYAKDAVVILGRATEGMEKLSDLSAMQQVGVGVGSAVAGALGTSIASDLYDYAKRSLSASRNFNNILKTNPGLLESHDKAHLRSAFNTIHRYGPEFTVDPMAGGALLRAAAGAPESIHLLVSGISKNRKEVIDAKRKNFEPRLDMGGSYMTATHRAEDKAERAEAERKKDASWAKPKSKGMY